MADDNKAVGQLATAKLVALIKAETAKKYDKTGGKIDGSAKITGDLQVAGYAECGAMEAQTYIKGDAMVMSPVIMLDDAATDVYLSAAGDGAAKMTITDVDADAPLARLKVATPTGDNDAATRAYVDGKAVDVDESLSDTSTNPVQNKAVKAALDGKLGKSGGDVTGGLNVDLSIGAGGSVSVGRTDADSGIHLSKAANDAGKFTHGSAGADDTVPLARLKVATPTEDDDAATKKYVADSAVRYDAAQELTDAQQIQARKNIGALNAKLAYIYDGMSLLPRNAGSAQVISVTPSVNNNVYALALDGGPENALVLLSGLETPTDAQTNAAANVAYVKAKIAAVEASGGIDVDDALSTTSTNPVQNKAVAAALNNKAGKSVATQSAAGLMSAADKAKLDGVAAGANKTVVDAAMSDTSANPVQAKVVKAYIDDKVAAAGSNITVDAAMSDTSENPVQNKAVKAALDAAIAVRASTSAYGTTKLSNSTTSSSKTLAATPYAVKTALAQAKAYVDSAIAAAINSAY